MFLREKWQIATVPEQSEGDLKVKTILLIEL